MRPDRSEAIILQSIPSRERDKLVVFLTPEKSLTRKVKEALLAVEIEKRYPKDRILELYFNQVYFGHGAYGVEAAAQLRAPGRRWCS